MRIAVGLVHWPVYDRAKKVVATNVTNLDVHDIARACRVYGIERYYIIHPMQDQLMFVARMLEHWRIGDGAKFNPMRRTSLTMVHTAENLEAAIRDWGGDPYLVSTSTKPFEGVLPISFRELREKIAQKPSQSHTQSGVAVSESGESGSESDSEEQLFLLFGTGNGLTEQVLGACDYHLEPIRGASKDDYRHLSVRSAVSICLDRLLGTW
jgi:hypothetical protein